MSTTATEVHVGDSGLAIRLRVYEDGAPLDVSGASARSIKLRKPDGVALTRTATMPGGGTDGWLQYVTVPGDLDRPGTWEVQASISDLGGWSGHTTAFAFVVRGVIG